MWKKAIILCSICIVLCALTSPVATANTPKIPKPKVYNCSDAQQLRNALRKVMPGDNIFLNDGIYNSSVDSSLFRVTRSGNATHPIVMNSTGMAILTSGLESGYGLYINASYWIFRKLTIAYSKKGIFTENASFNVFDKITVHHTGDEGIHLKLNSTNNIIKNSRVRYTGRKNPGIGEGIYIGTATARLNGIIDHSDRNRIINNTMGPFISAEHIDIKEDTRGGLIYNNTFNATGQTGIHDSDTVVNLKGHDYTVSGNTIIHGLNDGFRLTPQNSSDLNSGCQNYVFNNQCWNTSPSFNEKSYGWSNSSDPNGACVRGTRSCYNMIDSITVKVL